MDNNETKNLTTVKYYMLLKFRTTYFVKKSFSKLSNSSTFSATAVS